MMKISEMIQELKNVQAKYGDLEIVGGYLLDDTTPSKIMILNEEGCEYTGAPDEKVAGAFIE